MVEECGYDSSSEFYDHCTVYRDRADVGFYLDLVSGSGGRVLELGCGTGRILLPLVRAGNRVTGLDSSPCMLDVCREKLEKEPPSVSSMAEIMLGDMRDFSLEDTYPLVIVPFRAFQHLLTAEDQIECLDCIRRHLDPGGTLVLDLFNPDIQYIIDEGRRSEFGGEEPFLMPDGRKVTRRFRNPSVDLAGQVMDCEIIYRIEMPDGSLDEAVHGFRLRYLFRYEAQHLLARCGFEVSRVLGDFHGEPFGSEWPGELILVARRVR